MTRSGRLVVACCLLLPACSGNKPATKQADQSPPPPAAILQFYAAPAVIAKGDRTLLCYGVEGAASVRLEPPIEELAPSRARCIEVAPAASTRYTLYAKGRATGEEVSQQVEVVIDPKLRIEKAAPPSASGLILFFAALPPKVSKGGTATLCYGAKGAASVKLTPPVQTLVPSDRLCFQVKPEATTEYVLTVTSATGATDKVSARVTVE